MELEEVSVRQFLAIGSVRAELTPPLICRMVKPFSDQVKKKESRGMAAATLQWHKAD